MTLTLSKTFPKVAGFELNANCLALCKSLAEFNESTARFYDYDILSLVESGDADLENVDCLLLFNVVHQLIFARGLDFVKAFFRKVTSQIDVVFVELATRSDYKPHGKDQLLPISPAEVLAECDHCNVELLAGGSRPIYKISRRNLALHSQNFEYDSISFSDNPRAEISRKFYSGSSKFIKAYRFTDKQGDMAFKAEVSGLLKVRGGNIAPRIWDWQLGNEAGYIAMERIYGPSLSGLYPTIEAQYKQRIVKEIIRIASELADAGIYQNDLSAHNLIVTSSWKLFLIDFEQSRDYPLYDHFAFFLWILHDLWLGSPESYKAAVYRNLGTKGKEVRVDSAYYPDLSSLKQNGFFTQLIEDAETTDDKWPTFARRWHREVRDQ